MKYDQIIQQCMKIIKTFNPVVMTVDSHAEVFLKGIPDENVRVFVKQVFYGSYRYAEFFNVFNEAIFKANPASTNRNDGTLYSIFLYLICFRLSELPYDDLKRLIYTQDAVKLNVFLQFLFDMSKMKTFVRDGWCEIYDYNYIDNTILKSLEDNLGYMANILSTISEKATGKQSDLVVSSYESQESELEEAKGKKAPITKFQPFNLTKPKPKKIPEPILIPKLIKANPVPANLSKTSKDKIEETKKKRLEKISEETKKKYEESKSKRFDFQTEKRPNNLEKIKEEIEKKREAELQFDKGFFRPAPDFSEKQAEVRLNVAAILKEHKKLEKKKYEEEKVIKDLEMNMRDSTEFNNWRDSEKKAEEIQNLELQQKRKIEMELAREAAMKAYEEKQSENRTMAEKMKELGKEKLRELEVKLKDELENKKNVIQDIQEIKENIATVKQGVFETNKNKHDDAKAEFREMKERKKEEDLIELKKREELIKQIRELDRAPKERTKGFDPTETGKSEKTKGNWIETGYGFLEEMSLVELRERLAFVKAKREKEKEDKRLENSKKKDDTLSSLKSKISEIEENRQATMEEKRRKKELKKQKEEEEMRKRQEIREKSLMEVHSKITDKKKKKNEEDRRLAKELKEIKLKRQYLNANQAMVEAKAWKSLQDGAEREIQDRQNTKLITQEKIESINYKEKKIMTETAKKLVQTKIEFLKDYDEKLEIANKENEELHREMREEKQKLHQTQRKYELEHTKNMIDRDPFKQKLSDYSLTNAKSKMKSMSKRSGSAKNERSMELPPAKYEGAIPE